MLHATNLIKVAGIYPAVTSATLFAPSSSMIRHGALLSSSVFHPAPSVPTHRAFATTAHLATDTIPSHSDVHFSAASSSSTQPRNPSDALRDAPKTTDDAEHQQGLVGVEGRHFQDDRRVQHNDVIQPATQEDSTSATVAAVAPSPPSLSDPYNGAWTMTRPVYTETQLNAVKVVRRDPETASDRIAAGLVQFARRGFDFFSGYKHRPLPANHRSLSVEELRARGCCMTPEQWLSRVLQLEAIAGVPGMVGGAVRHLHSLRLMKRDGAWIHTLLEEAENERMHLLTFLSLKQPGFWLRALVLASQGVFYNVFFATYLFAPKAAHRFVACLEEEAVVTYTRLIDDIQEGRLPEWEGVPAPEIAISYWRLPESSTLLDVIRAIRADESTHRFVNHTLASIDKNDFNPFAIAEPDAETRGRLPGFSREEAARFAQETREKLAYGNTQPPPLSIHENDRRG